MTKASDNDFPSILVTELAAKPTAPAAGKQRIYMKTDHKMYTENNGGTETEVGAGVARSGSTTDEHMAVWNGTDADSLKDGGAVASAVVFGTYTPTVTAAGGNPTVTMVTGSYVKTSKHLEVWIDAMGFTANGSGLYLFSLPAGMTIDTTLHPACTIPNTDGGNYTLFAPLGTAVFGVAGNVYWEHALMVFVADSTHLAVAWPSPTTADRMAGLGSWRNLISISATACRICLHASMILTS